MLLPLELKPLGRLNKSELTSENKAEFNFRYLSLEFYLSS
jgi:hypothetical protein